ncbi:MAG: protein translocase subunit SecF [bacterium]|jgi:preprotein translocase SecF subunit
MRFFTKPDHDFIGWRKRAFLFSAVLIGAGLISLAIHGGPELSIDFRGGVLVQVKFDRQVTTEDVRSSLDKIGYGDVEIQRFASGDEFIIRGPYEPDEDVSGDMIAAIRRDMAGADVDVRRVELVGPKIGSELAKRAALAVGIALLAILIYIAWRFEFRFAVAAVVTLLHDVLVTLGLFSLTGREISLAVIAAFLTIVGYSLNDTIVVFDRIREDLRKYHRKRYEEVVNASINETLSRTVITSLTTLVVILFLFFMGGEVLRDFSFALLIGVLVGTYSSIFVASPILVEWNRKSPAKRR